MRTTNVNISAQLTNVGRQNNATSHTLWLSPTKTEEKQSARPKPYNSRKGKDDREGRSPCLNGHTYRQTETELKNALTQSVVKIT